MIEIIIHTFFQNDILDNRNIKSGNFQFLISLNSFHINIVSRVNVILKLGILVVFMYLNAENFPT